jgi:hypothetical protein
MTETQDGRRLIYMRKSIQKPLALALLFAGLCAAEGVARQQAKRTVQTGGVTGTYKYVLNTIEVLEMPDHKVRISFAGYWPNDHKRAETRNVGTFDETVALDGRTATVKIQFGDEPCTITLAFRSNKVIVEQAGSLMGCGFGFNVEPDGTYMKTSSRPPHLPPR